MKYRLVPLLLVISLLTGCAQTLSTLSRSSLEPLPPVQGDLLSVEPWKDPGDGALRGYGSFALELLRQNMTPGENTLVSPLSVTLALGMTANGAAGDTLGEFETLFALDRDQLNSLCVRFMEDYAHLKGSTESNLVNSLWADPDATLDNGFVLRCQETYKAQLFQQDLQDPETVKAVNRWVCDATRGMIPSVVDHFAPDTVLSLINAIYFKNQFERPFETPHSDWEMDFTAADGAVTHPKGMTNGTRREEYISAENGQGVLLPYDDGRLGLLLMLPDEGLSLSDYLSGWDADTVPSLLAGRGSALVDLVCPKFKTEWGSSINGSLTAMGLERAFDPSRADFSAMGSAEGVPFFIGNVIHKTAFELSEKGTEAAAVTAVMMAPTAGMPPSDMIILRFDRPFVYGIVDTETGAPLFLGTMESCE